MKMAAGDNFCWHHCSLYILYALSKNKHFLNKQTKNCLREDTGYGDLYFLNIKKGAVWEFQFCVQPSLIFPSAE